jgi:hypothetical protein
VTATHGDVVREVAERVALWNEVRSDDFQDQVARLVDHARESFRDARGELPRAGADALYDALVSLALVADSAPITVRDACARALEAAEESRTARR